MEDYIKKSNAMKVIDAVISMAESLVERLKETRSAKWTTTGSEYTTKRTHLITGKPVSNF